MTVVLAIVRTAGSALTAKLVAVGLRSGRKAFAVAAWYFGFLPEDQAFAEYSVQGQKIIRSTAAEAVAACSGQDQRKVRQTVVATVVACSVLDLQIGCLIAAVVVAQKHQIVLSSVTTVAGCSAQDYRKDHLIVAEVG